MRLVSKSALFIGTLLIFHNISVHPMPFARDEVMTQEIKRPLNTASLDDYLIDMARSTSINIIADATDFPSPSTVKPYPSTPGAIEGLKGQYKDKWGNILLNMLGDVIAQQKLSTLRCDDRTFLFWSEPDPHQLSILEWSVTVATEKAHFDEAIAAAKAAGIPEKEVITGVVEETQLHKLLWDYLKEEHDWTGTPAQLMKPVDFETHFDELPPNLRALVWTSLRQQFVKQGNDFLQDDFWNSIGTRLRIEKKGNVSRLVGRYVVTKPDGTKVPDYFVVANINDDTTIQGTVLVPDSSLEEPAKPITPEPQDTLLNAYRGITDDASNPTLDADASLNKTITLQTKRTRLQDTLLEVAKQTGLKFKLGDKAPGEKLITAYIEKMPISHFMGVLSRVYGVKWSKDNDTYLMNDNDQGQLHLKLLQLGDPLQYRYRFTLMNRADRINEPTAISQAIIQSVGREALLSADGVPVTSLTPALQQRLRHDLEDPYDERQVIRLYDTNRMFVDQIAKKGFALRFGNAVVETYRAPNLVWNEPKMPGILCFNVQTDDRQVILPMFQSFNLILPKDVPGKTPPPTHRR